MRRFVSLAIMLMLCVVFSYDVSALEPVMLDFDCPRIVYVGEVFSVDICLDPNNQPVDFCFIGEVRYNDIIATEVSVAGPWRTSYSSLPVIMNGKYYEGRIKDISAFMPEPINERTVVVTITFVAMQIGRCSLSMRSVEVRSGNLLYDTSSTSVEIIDIKINESDEGNYGGINSPPIASVEQGSRTVIVGDTVEFISTSYDVDGYIDTYYWDMGDGSIYDNESVKHIYSNTGIYTVNLTVTDNDGESDSTNFSIKAIRKIEEKENNSQNNSNQNNSQNNTQNNTQNDSNGNNSNNSNNSIVPKQESFDLTAIAIVSVACIAVTVVYNLGKYYVWW